MAKCTDTLFLKKRNFFKILKRYTQSLRLYTEIQQSTISTTYSTNCLTGLYYYIIGDHNNALKYLYDAFTFDNDAQSYYYLVRLLWSQTTESQRQIIIIALTPSPTMSKQSIFLKQWSTGQLLKLATIYLTIHNYNITIYLLHYIIDNHPFCFEQISVKYLQGMMYELGNYYEKNVDIALCYYEEAANAGLPLAMYDLGRLYAISKTEALVVTSNVWRDKALKRKALRSPSSLFTPPHLQKHTTTLP